MKSHRLKLPAYILLSALIGLSAVNCDTASSGGEGEAEVTLRMQSSLSPAKVSSSGNSMTGDTLRISTQDALLLINDIRFISKKFKLERDDAACDDDSSGNTVNEDECEELDFPPAFVDLPLDGSALDLVTSIIPAGLYEELEFEIDNLDIDEDDDEEERSQKEALLQEARSVYADWPDKASMIIVGTYVDGNGAETDFTTYAEAEVEIELEFNPPVQIDENTAVNNLIDININPESWFLNTDGTLVPIWTYDFATTGELLEFEVEIENGFESVELEDDEDDDEEDGDDD